MNHRTTPYAKSAAALIALTILLYSGRPARAQAGEKSSSLAPVAAVIDDQTLMVVRVDLTRVGPAAVEAWMLDVMKSNPNASDRDAFTKEIGQARASAESWIAKFRAAGGRELFLVVGMSDLATKGEPVVVASVGAGADLATLGDLMKSSAPTAPPERIGDSLVVASVERMARIKAGKPVERPELAKAMDAAGDGAIHVAAATSADMRRAIEESASKLPTELGGGPGGVLTQGVLWASLSVKPPPQPSLKLVIQSKDAEAARALSDLIEKAKLLAIKRANSGQSRFPDVPPTQHEAFLLALTRVMDAATPQRQGDQLVLTLGEDGFNRLGGLALSIPRQRQAAARVKSASNMRQLTLVCLMWATERKDAWPDDLNVAAKEQIGDEPSIKGVMENPAKPGTGFVYIKPPAGVKNPSERVVLYEAVPTTLYGDDAKPNGEARNVAFMDGRVEFVLEKDFQARLEAQNEASDPKRNPSGGPKE